MSEELRKKFRESAQPAEGSPIPTICMYESEAIEFAKVYADAKSLEKDTEIERLEFLNEISTKDGIARQKEAIRLNDEILELKATNSALIHDYEWRGRTIDRLEAELNQMRNQIQKTVDYMESNSISTLKFDEVSDHVLALKSLLSEPKSPWISVLDQEKPKVGERVLVVQNPDTTATREPLFAFYNGKDFIPATASSFEYVRESKSKWADIIFWMHLPSIRKAPSTNEK